MIQKIEKYGKQTICYVLNGKNCQDKNTSLAIVKANELCELDGGIELLRTKNNKLPKLFNLHGVDLDFNIIYATPDTKHLARNASRKYKAALVMIYE